MPVLPRFLDAKAPALFNALEVLPVLRAAAGLNVELRAAFLPGEELGAILGLGGDGRWFVTLNLARPDHFDQALGVLEFYFLQDTRRGYVAFQERKPQGPTGHLGDPSLPPILHGLTYRSN